MKIIRWLLSHIFLILLIIVVIYGYMFWGNLLGSDTPAGKAIAYLSSEFPVVEDFVTAVKEKQAKLGSEEDVAQAADDAAQPAPVISYSHNQTQVTQDSGGVVETGEQVAAASMSQQAAGEQSMAPASVVAGATSPQAAKQATAQPAEPAQPPAEEKFVSAEISKQLDNVDKQGKVIDPSRTSEEVRKNWITARKSFYQRQYEQSEKSYQQVIDSTEDNFDAYGELGNVYFNQGKNKQAASAYYEAAAILVKKGQVNRARSLMGLLRHLDRTKAEELQKLIDSTAS